jgi:hypothetical protein
MSVANDGARLERRDRRSRQGKARQGKARQGKARQGKARQGKARQGKARQGKERIEFDLHRPGHQQTGAGSPNFGEAIADFVFLPERNHSILVDGVTLTLEVRVAWPPTRLRRLLHPVTQFPA